MINNSLPKQRLSIQGAKSSLFGGSKNRDETPLPTTAIRSDGNQLLQQQEDVAEQDIEEKTSLLRKGVSTLKDLSRAIGDEITDQNRLLGDMSNQMHSAQDALSKTLKKLEQLMQSSSTRHMCLLVLFIFVVFVILYFMLKWYM